MCEPIDDEGLLLVVFEWLVVLDARRHRDRRDGGADLRLDGVGDLGVLAQELLGVLAALAQARLAEEKKAPAFLTMPISRPTSIRPPSREMPSLYMMSNSAMRNGGATLFLTTLTLARLPITSVPSLIESMRRMSRRTEA